MEDNEGKPVSIDVEEAFGLLVDTTGEALRVSLTDAEGGEIAAVVGVLIGPVAFAVEGERFGEFALSQDGMAATIRIPMDPASHCTIAPDGVISGSLPSGASWQVSRP